ncbi:STAS domain-containing protein [Herbidospora galbida]|uniref:Anti-sigma factor antagonist n=1 Tax=Herbidospora galbida TaxID=2575442 RepID=A0A4U3MLS5_9ACTN|nr:STAS domain-containing protein [Herbidospora galbida]TKK90431.1 STAS domain-containing protein [Herbidospora galbida]
MSDIELTVETTPAGPLLRLAGELDYISAPQVVEALQHITLEPAQRLIVDLSALTFCDSRGIATLIAARNKAHAADAELALAAVSDRLMHIMNVLGLSRLLLIYPTVEAAIGR